MTTRFFPRSNPSMKVGKALLLTLPMVLFASFMMVGGAGLPQDPLQAVALAVTWLTFNGSFFMMVWTGRVDRYRAPLFILLAFAMIITFAFLIESTRGSTVLTEDDMVNGRVPFCHLVIPMILAPAAAKGIIIFPGSLIEGFASIGSMVVLWIGASLVLGRGFCSWGCFYGGYDDAFSRILKKPVIKKIARRWIYFPFALLVAIVLLSAATLSPTYCEWLCPFKAVTEYAEVTSTLVLVQTIIFVALFIGLVIVLPILTRKRTQCGLFCPFGAMQSFTNGVTPFAVRIDTEKCTGCKQCIQACPTFSLDESSLESGKPLITCTRCGKCMAACRQGAISYHIKGTQPGKRPLLARMLFLYPAFLFLVTFSSGTVIMAIWRVLNLITNGSMQA